MRTLLTARASYGMSPKMPFDFAHAGPRLLRWFDRAQRDLPWRRTRDPYAIWISEVMLQQTQVVTVIPYFERFLRTFPTVAALAAAPLGDVLSMWSGLGYYSRARNLHRAAQVIVAEHGGLLPASVIDLLELPGFGRYTAGAVASIAFGIQAPLVDGNVSRVLTRLFAVDEEKREKRIWELAALLVPAKRPGDFNQALMELGATVCLPSKPLCLLCPVRGDCLALAQGRVDQLPPPKVRAPRKQLNLAVAVCRRGTRLLVMRREDGGLFGGLWELPSSPPDALAGLLGSKGAVGDRLGTVTRTLTHRELTLELWSAKAGAALKVPPGYQGLRWVTSEQLNALGISSATRAVLKKIAFV
jgi:A/G-specific adenine glycosylase